MVDKQGWKNLAWFFTIVAGMAFITGSVIMFLVCLGLSMLAFYKERKEAKLAGIAQSA